MVLVAGRPSLIGAGAISYLPKGLAVFSLEPDLGHSNAEQAELMGCTP